MKLRQVIRPVPASGIFSGCVVVDGHIAYVEDDDGSAAPADAIYVCRQDTSQTKVPFVVDKDTTLGKLSSKHAFAGWPLPNSAK